MRLVLRVRTAIPPYLTPYSYPHQLAGAKESAKTNAAKAAAYRAASSGEEIMSELISNVTPSKENAPSMHERDNEHDLVTPFMDLLFNVYVDFPQAICLAKARIKVISSIFILLLDI